MVAFTGVLTYVAIQQFLFNKASSKSSTEQINKILDASYRIEDAADSFSGNSTHINDGIGDAVKKLQIQATILATKYPCPKSNSRVLSDRG